ncbi:MAG: UDP-N-acetylmuramoylalanyl-D-glutamyl-2, 6-diaminopimelate--D-alanyl-D-alanine ligase, partial [Magnetovibrio sp.]|nr:UDP-N-acetylmuramoylalanyl-D-glutamyl-2, 6-diaminopimelate--D-alanyl-D-alanine ligase [Magnetovibrio sp.]
MSRIGHCKLWEGAEVLKVVSGKGGCADWSANGISIDSRRIANGDLFVAIKGNNFDGNKFAVEALNSGAIAALTQADVGSAEHTARVLIVEDTMEALRELGREARNRSNAKVVVVTGRVGKTGTKTLLAAGMK